MELRSSVKTLTFLRLNFLPTLLLVPAILFANEPCDPQPDHGIPELTENASRASELARLQADPNLFCNETLEVRMLLSRGHTDHLNSEEIYAAAAAGKLEQLTNNALDNIVASSFYHDLRFGEYDSWNLSLIPLERSRLAVTQMIKTDFKTTSSSNVMDLDEAVQYLNLDRCSLPPPLPQDSRIGQITGTKATAKDYGFSGTLKPLAFDYSCSEVLGILNATACQKSFQVIERISTPLKDSTYAGMELFGKVLDDSRYDEGLRLAALQAAGRVKDGTEASSNYFEDLKTSFRKAGSSERDAEEMAWTVAGMIATAGPNLAGRLYLFPHKPEQTQKRIALQVLANTLPILDHRSAKKGQLYSLPQGVTGACNSGKSYHFWYTAYLARRAALETQNPLGAATSAFQSEKFYQVLQRIKQNSLGGTRFITSPTFSPTSEIVRADLANAIAGASYGAAQATDRAPSPVNIDRVLGNLIKSAGGGSVGLRDYLAEQVVGSPAQHYAKWKMKFNSNEAFKGVIKGGFSNKVRQDFLDFEKHPTKANCNK